MRDFGNYTGMWKHTIHPMSSNINIIACMATYKTSIVKLINKKFGFNILEEDFDVPYIKESYNGGEMSYMKLQFSMLTRYLESYHEAMNNDKCNIMDAFFYSGYCFSTTQHKMGFIDDIDYGEYLRLFSIYDKMLELKELKTFVLYDKPENIMKNIAVRGRDFEKNISIDFIEILNNEFLKMADKRKFQLVNVEGKQEGVIPPEIEDYINSVYTIKK